VLPGVKVAALGGCTGGPCFVGGLGAGCTSVGVEVITLEGVACVNSGVPGPFVKAVDTTATAGCLGKLAGGFLSDVCWVG